MVVVLGYVHVLLYPVSKTNVQVFIDTYRHGKLYSCGYIDTVITRVNLCIGPAKFDKEWLK